MRSTHPTARHSHNKEVPMHLSWFGLIFIASLAGTESFDNLHFLRPAEEPERFLGKQTLKTLVDALGGSDGQVRKEAAAALVSISATRESIVAVLLDAAKDNKNREKRANAI